MKCGNCNTEFEGNFCPNCGANTNNSAQNNHDATQQTTNFYANAEQTPNLPNPQSNKPPISTALVIILLIVFIPVGLYFMWEKTNWNKIVKIAITVIIGIAYIFTISNNINKANSSALNPTDAAVQETTVQQSNTVGTTSIDENENATQESTSKDTDKKSTTANGNATYQSILDDYSNKIKNATPTLIKEYQAEAAKNSGSVDKLAQILNSKKDELASLCNDGIEEMAKLMQKSGSNDYSEYEQWAAKLQDVYMSEASKITDAYYKSMN